jgi:hypothetical protein
MSNEQVIFLFILRLIAGFFGLLAVNITICGIFSIEPKNDARFMQGLILGVLSSAMVRWAISGKL